MIFFTYKFFTRFNKVKKETRIDLKTSFVLTYGPVSFTYINVKN